MDKKALAILTVGKTHAGKSHFAKELVKSLPNSAVLDADIVASFLQKKFPKLHELDREQSGAFKNVPVKYQIFKAILKAYLDLKHNVVLSNANLSEKVRTDIITEVKKHHYETVGVYFDYSEEHLLKQIEKAKKDTSVLTISKSFEELLTNQRKWLQPPSAKEFDHFFLVRKPEELTTVIKSIVKIVRAL
jgi:predicted kinase